MQEATTDTNDVHISTTEEDYSNPFRKGSNPHYSTARGKLQKKRSRLNDDIIKELRLRRGAENLLRATNNRSVKEQVQVELNFVTSKLEVLRADLAQLNSSVKIYQNENSSNSVPMIPLGLKETKDIDYEQAFQDYIEEHYSESGSEYSEAIRHLNEMRKAIRTPERSEAGVELLFNYYNQLWYVEKRFYPPGRIVPIYFTWYDSLEGTSVAQRTIGFEKGSVLFNIGALYTQIGTRQDRSTTEGLQRTVEYYQKGAGVFKYLRDRFTHAPSVDMNAQTLTLLMQLMLSQGQECLFEQMVIELGTPATINDHFRYAQEAAVVAQMYEETHNAVATKSIRKSVPPSWITMTIMKSNHFKALSHYHLAAGLLLHKGETSSLDKILLKLEEVTVDHNSSKNHGYTLDKQKQTQYCRAHIKAAMNLNETARRDYNFCRELKSQDDAFYNMLSDCETKASLLLVDVYTDNDYEDIFLSAPSIKGKAQDMVTLALPSFSEYKVEDFFKSLGPLSIFSAKSEWTAPRSVVVSKSAEMGYGFTIKGECPTAVVDVNSNGPAQLAGILMEDILVKVNGKDVKWMEQADIKELIQQGGERLSLSLVTPMAPAQCDSPIEKSQVDDTIRSSNSSGSGDMKQMTGTITSTWRRKMNNLTFLKNKKSMQQSNSSGSLR